MGRIYNEFDLPYTADLETIRVAGAAFLGTNAPVVTILGVQSLSRDGALIAIGATAMSAR